MFKSKSKAKDNYLVRFSFFFYDHLKLSTALWSVVIFFGVLCYTTLLDIQGFPPVQVPLNVVSGTYFVGDEEIVDKKLAQPFSEIVGDIEGVASLTTRSSDDFFSSVIEFEEEISASKGAELVSNAIESSNAIPKEANLEILPIEPSSYRGEFDLLVSVYSEENTTPGVLEERANKIIPILQESEVVERAEVQSLFSESINPYTKQIEQRQTSFGRIGLSNNGDFNFYSAVIIGVDGSEGFDVIDLNEGVQKAIDEIEANNSDIRLTISADFAPIIQTQISGLETNLLEGLIIVTIISFLLISWRASVITAIFMVLVLLTSFIIMYLLGYTLNTITLFALVLSLGLLVDDATIVLEAIEAEKDKHKKPRDAMKAAISKVGIASFAGTWTTILTFLPLAFITGILGDFIRVMPIMVSVALALSLFYSLTFVPYASKSLILKSKNPGSLKFMRKLEAYLSSSLYKSVRLLKTKRKTGFVVAFGAIGASIIMIIGSGYFFNKLQFNIFPEQKDSDSLNVGIVYDKPLTIRQADEIAIEVDKIIEETVNEDASRVIYGSDSAPNAQNTSILVELTPFTERDKKAPEIAEELQTELSSSINGAQFVVGSIGSGPPSDAMPFKMQIYGKNKKTEIEAAQEIESFLKDNFVTRNNGTKAYITNTKITNVSEIARKDGEEFIEIQAGYDSTDVTALLLATEEKILNEYTDDKLEQFGLDQSRLKFDYGFESDSQESFSALLYVGPITILIMFLLLVFQFKSIIQPLAIFLAIPFGLFGVSVGLYLTDNALSFFTMIGLFSLTGIAVNNTILLTDYANQERRKGFDSVDSMATAIKNRFRPLITTSITTIAALVPLILFDPFWEALAVTIAFGLMSSTFLVIVSFPYYYIVIEKIRGFIKRMFRSIISA